MMNHLQCCDWRDVSKGTHTACSAPMESIPMRPEIAQVIEQAVAQHCLNDTDLSVGPRKKVGGRHACT